MDAMTDQRAPLLEARQSDGADYGRYWDLVFPVNEHSDFSLVRCVRRALLDKDEVGARRLLERYPFWYHQGLPRTSQVFWTENHMIMTISSEYLIREFLREHLPHTLRNRVERFVDLKLKCGMAEFLSPVYLPYTLAGLLNIHDFTSNITLKAHTRDLIDNIAEHLLTLTTADGSFLSPAGRTYRRFRERSTQHHIHDFLCFLIRVSAETRLRKEADTVLSEFLASTSYQPSQRVYQNFRAEILDVQIKASPTWQELMMHVEEWRADTPLEDLVSFLWSHGAYFHPQIMADVITFMDLEHIWDHPHFRLLRPARYLLCCFTRRRIASMLAWVVSTPLLRSLALGSLLTDAVVHVHKEGDVILSALCGYNNGMRIFQQWPWIVNLAGSPIWASLEYTHGTWCRRANTSLRNEPGNGLPVMPEMNVRGNVLAARYPRNNMSWRTTEVRIHWPKESFDRHGSELGRGGMLWQWAVRSHVAVACCIRDLTVYVVVRDLRLYGENGVDMPTHTFLERAHAWVSNAELGA